MDKQKMIDAVIVILQNPCKNDEALQHQLISANELLASLIIELGNGDKPCEHPNDMRKNLSCMGDVQKTEQCLNCGEIIKSEW